MTFTIVLLIVSGLIFLLWTVNRICDTVEFCSKNKAMVTYTIAMKESNGKIDWPNKKSDETGVKFDRSFSCSDEACDGMSNGMSHGLGTDENAKF